MELQHSIPSNIGDNTELIMRINSGIQNNGSLWTDESGLEMHERIHDATLPISGNYHVSWHAKEPLLPVIARVHPFVQHDYVARSLLANAHRVKPL